ncbi:MAG: BlaI/MecI/CopY family transcriptional regulator [Flavobacteriaceae bacterium]|nr:BlaI/MecI/CopY family transcriptional regulator [Flavobacteriaceae bacterium]
MIFSNHQLGELEWKILELFWDQNIEMDVKTVHAVIFEERKITLNTVQSAMERLYRKELLDRKKVSHSYWYFSMIDKESFIYNHLDHLIDDFGNETSIFLNAFVNLAKKKGKSNLESLLDKVKDALNLEDPK